MPFHYSQTEHDHVRLSLRTTKNANNDEFLEAYDPDTGKTIGLQKSISMDDGVDRVCEVTITFLVEMVNRKSYLPDDKEQA